ncbi:hypothetical protein DFH07DRAFT_100469 [Mycena maculata]|uniref:Uncharacterized protein n=1 Tax=Mycena maculata TaxID=230809 RepID=A0AAD7JY78_9AGAR|nr:hypothetical protein DFH07DRAFT_100469 [Mycena maculata]
MTLLWGSHPTTEVSKNRASPNYETPLSFRKRLYPLANLQISWSLVGRWGVNVSYGRTVLIAVCDRVVPGIVVFLSTCGFHIGFIHALCAVMRFFLRISLLNQASRRQDRHLGDMQETPDPRQASRVRFNSLAWHIYYRMPEDADPVQNPPLSLHNYTY